MSGFDGLAAILNQQARELVEHGQAAMREANSLGNDVGQFMLQRLSRGGEALGRMTQCHSLPEILNVEADWLREAFDDYAQQASRLMDFNARLVGFAVNGEAPVEAAPFPAKPGRPGRPGEARAPQRETAGAGG